MKYDQIIILEIRESLNKLVKFLFIHCEFRMIIKKTSYERKNKWSLQRPLASVSKTVLVSEGVKG